MRLQLNALAALAAVLLVAHAACADLVIARSGNAELKFENVTLTKVIDGSLNWTSASGTTQQSRPVDVIIRVEVPGEDAFNKAEKAYYEAAKSKDEKAARQKYSETIPDYQQALRSAKQAVKDMAAIRLKEVAPKSGRFDAAIDAWLPEAIKNPEAALKNKPTTEGIDPKSTYLTNAIPKLQAASSGSSVSAAQKRAVLSLLVDVYRAQGDTNSEMKTVEVLATLGGNPEELDALNIKFAMAEYSKKNFDAALARLAKVTNLDAQSDDNRADALWVTAEARAAKLSSGAAPEAIKDVAIDYMRVAAGFPASVHAPAALLKVGELHEQLKDADTALKTYQAVAREYPKAPAAQAAKQNADRLAKAAPPKP